MNTTQKLKTHINNLQHQLNQTTKERNQLKQMIIEIDYKVTQILGQALGYPAYKDDPKNFPNVDPQDNTVCTADHVPETLATEAAQTIKKLKQLIEKKDTNPKTHPQPIATNPKPTQTPK